MIFSWVYSQNDSQGCSHPKPWLGLKHTFLKWLTHGMLIVGKSRHVLPIWVCPWACLKRIHSMVASLPQNVRSEREWGRKCSLLWLVLEVTYHLSHLCIFVKSESVGQLTLKGKGIRLQLLKRRETTTLQTFILCVCGSVKRKRLMYNVWSSF